MFQLYNIVIHNFKGYIPFIIIKYWLYSLYYILISFWLISYIAVCIC